MKFGLILQTTNAEKVWNAFRLANTALETGHTVEMFLLGEGVTAPDIDPEKYNAHGLMRKYVQDGGTLLACGTCLDSRNLDEDQIRPRGTMADYLQILEETDEVLMIG